ncbi:MAG: PAS domain S-box protein [Actinomycetota bacterium]
MNLLARRRILLACGAAALVGAVVSLIVQLGSHHMRPNGFELAVDLVVGLSFAATGLIAWSRRPENNTGRRLLAVSFAWFLGLLGSANDAVVSAIGIASGALMLAAFVHLVLAYPTGRLQTRADRVIVVSGYTLALGANLLTLMFVPHPACPACAKSVLLISDQPTVGRAVDNTTNVIAAILIATVVGLLVVRYRAATPVARRMFRSIGLTGAAALTFLSAGFAAGPFNQSVKNVLVSIALFSLASVPFWFLAGLLRSRLARGGVAQLLLDVRETASLEEAQDGLRRALNDAGVLLAAWVDERHGYVDPDGRAFEVPSDEVDRVATMVASESGDHLAVIVHDRALLDEPELLDAVAVAARLALHRNRLQAELRARLDELQRERDFMRDVVNAAPAFFCVVDLEGGILRFNDTMAKACGVLDDEETRGRSIWDVFVAPVDVAAFRECVLASAVGEQQHLFRGADGGVIDVAWSITPIADSQGVLRLVLTGADVSERVRHADELRRERDFLELVGHSTPTILCVVDPNGVVTERGVNTAFEVATGVADEAAIGRPFWELVVPEDELHGARAAFFDAVEGGCTTRIESPWRAADGSEIVVEWWPTSLDGYRKEHYLICAMDITARKRDEEELRRSRSRLVDAADAERRRLERNLHDGAQQRLVSLSLALRLAESKLRADPETASTILRGAGEELALALQELRELARGLHPAILTDRGLEPALETLAERSNVPVEVEVDLDRRLPGPVEVAIFYVVSESLANVAKYAGATAVTVRVAHAGDSVVVEVADNGVGGADDRRGSGLRGLADRVEALDGRLSVESPAGGGTRVLANMPLARVRQPVPSDAG